MMSDDVTNDPGTTPDPTAATTPPDPAPAPAAASTPAPPDPTAASAPPADDVAAKLTELGITDADIFTAINSIGVKTVDDLSMVTEADLVSAGVPVIQARKLAGAVAPAAPAVDIGGAAVFDVLPGVPDDGPWLEALRTGGVLKIDQSTVIAGVRAALATRVGLFDVPRRLVEEMEHFADSVDEQVDPEFFRLRKQLTRKTYGDIFEAIDGMDGSYVTEARKKELFRRIDEHLWPAIGSFYDQLAAWQQAWMQGATSMPMILASLAGAGAGVGLPPGILQPPDTAILRDHADAVNDALNKVFAGTGIQIATAVAYEASQIKKSLENTRLPQMIGAANRDQMLKQLGVSVSATYPRLETNITKFILAVLQAKDQPAGNEELQYFGALFMLGSQIDWAQLGVGVTGRGRKATGVGGPVDL